jgi:hypothetical protein
VTQPVIRKLHSEARGDRHLLGPWSDQRELAAEDVPQLRKLIDPEAPQMPSDVGDAVGIKL